MLKTKYSAIAKKYKSNIYKWINSIIRFNQRPLGFKKILSPLNNKALA